MLSPEAVVDLAAIAHNVGVLRERSGAEVIAVVKADGYGHGAVAVARAALAAGASELGVATVGEALALRRAGVTAPVIAWLHAPSTDFVAAVQAGVEVVVSTPGQLDAVVAAAHRLGRTATVGVKVDTGLARSGVSERDWPDVCALLKDEALVLRTVMCHLARGDEPGHPLNAGQAAGLDDRVVDLRRAGLRPQRVHLANSAAALTDRSLARDIVRTGIAIYGRSPVPALGDFGLTPAMTMTAEVAQVRRIRGGQGVSYNHAWVAPADTVVGVLACGYADGVPRALSNRLPVHINGRRFDGVGRICMDQLVVDLGHDGGGVTEGDRAVLFGGAGVTAGDWANATGTIDYEILTGIGGRTERRYLPPDSMTPWAARARSS
ncbi:alanine racemase [Mycolicibacterium fluoranthenivorans]|uniref:alanine racemase n=1 Tax=Mycolicibacterium fluoranthenivorans TaxID=258505 RepID=UPI00141E8D66|nr:alanine racemase [Mycolicibacterium fluoranthenivorans]MCV7356610.1 alanine racemase [Mycolicibacterium fluoranthenivorans]